MDIKQILEQIAPDVDEVVGRESTMAKVRKRRRTAWLVRTAAVAAVILGFVAIAVFFGGGEAITPAATTTIVAPASSTVATTVPSAAPTPTGSTPKTEPGVTRTLPSMTSAPTTSAPTTSAPTTSAPTASAPPPTTAPPATVPILEPLVIGWKQLADYSTIVAASTTGGPDVPMGNDDGDGSGCSPGTVDTLPDGIWYAVDLEVTTDGQTAMLEFDLVCRYSDDERQAIYTPDEVIYDRSITNESPLLRTMPFAADARLIDYLSGEPDIPVWLNAVSYAVLRSGRQDLPYGWIKTIDGEVVEVFLNFEA